MKHWITFAILALGLSLTGCSETEFTSTASSSEKGTVKSSSDVELEEVVEIIEQEGEDEIPAEFRCGPKNRKVKICHVPPGNPAAKHTICIGAPAVRAHLNLHIAKSDANIRDTLGDCDRDREGSVEENQCEEEDHNDEEFVAE